MAMRYTITNRFELLKKLSLHKYPIISVLLWCFSCCSPKKEEVADKPSSEKPQKESVGKSGIENQQKEPQYSSGLDKKSFMELCSGLPPSLGETLSPTLIEQIKTIALDTKSLGTLLSASTSNILLEGSPESGLLSLLVKLNGNNLIGLDFTLNSSNEFTEKHKTDLFANYLEVGSRTIKLLNNKLETVTYSAFDYRNRLNSNLHAVTFNAEGLTRLVLFDSLSVSADQVIITADSLPPGLLEKARDIINKQNDLYDKK